MAIETTPGAEKISADTPLPIERESASLLDGSWLRNLVDRLDEAIPPGAIAETFVYGSLALGLGRAMRDKSPHPIITVAQGLLGATLANTISSVWNHRQASHHSVIMSPVTDEVGRFMQATEAGLKINRSAPVHKIHHATHDTDKDPHGPNKKGRWKVFFGISKLVRDYADDHPELIVEHQDNLTEPKPYDRPIVTILGIITTHYLLGEVTKQSILSRGISAGMHGAGAFLLNATFTSDSHLEGIPENLGLTPLTSIVLGGEDWHGDHHHHPKNPRHAKYDPGYLVIRLLEKVGLAEVPFRHHKPILKQ